MLVCLSHVSSRSLIQCIPLKRVAPCLQGKLICRMSHHASRILDTQLPFKDYMSLFQDCSNVNLQPFATLRLPLKSAAYIHTSNSDCEFTQEPAKTKELRIAVVGERTKQWIRVYEKPIKYFKNNLTQAGINIFPLKHYFATPTFQDYLRARQKTEVLWT